jgi:hypothetical protein
MPVAHPNTLHGSIAVCLTRTVDSRNRGAVARASLGRILAYRYDQTPGRPIELRDHLLHIQEIASRRPNHDLGSGPVRCSRRDDRLDQWKYLLGGSMLQANDFDDEVGGSNDARGQGKTPTEEDPGKPSFPEHRIAPKKARRFRSLVDSTPECSWINDKFGLLSWVYSPVRHRLT